MNENKIRAAIAENPLLVLFLGACPAMGASVGVIPALSMGLAVILIMPLSALIVSAIRKAVPGRAGIPALVLVVAGVTSVVQLLMNAFLPGAFRMLGVYLAVAAVNLLTFSAAEEAVSCGKAVKNSILTALGFACAMLVMGIAREVLGAGSFAGFDLPFFGTYNVPVLTQTSGGFFVFAILAAVIAAKRPMDGKKAEGFAAEAAGLSCVADAGRDEV